MAGNSQRRGRTTGAGKKTATAGTGGKNRRSLAGRGATPPAEARPGHPAQRKAAAARIPWNTPYAVRIDESPAPPLASDRPVANRVISATTSMSSKE